MRAGWTDSPQLLRMSVKAPATLHFHPVSQQPTLNFTIKHPSFSNMADDSRISPYNVSGNLALITLQSQLILTSTPDCKNTTDDALQNYLNGLKFRQSHWYTDVKLGLGYTAVIIAAITFALDYKFGFEATKAFTTLAVVIYFLLNGAFTWWIWQVEKSMIYVGAWKGRKVSSRHTARLRLSFV